MKKKTLVLNYIYNLSYQLINVIVPVLITPYVSRTLGANAIGAYSFCFSITNYFMLLGTFGLNMFGQIAISRCREDEEKTNTTFWNIFIAKILTSILSILIYCIFIVIYEDYTLIFVTLIIALIANMLDISWFFQGLEEFKSIAIRNYIIKLASLIFIFALVKNADDIYKYIVILHTSTLLGNFALFTDLRKRIHKIEFRSLSIKSYVLSSSAFFLPAIVTSVFSAADKVMIGFVLNSEFQNGIYEQAHKIEQTLITIVSSLSSVMLPRMAFYVSQNDDNSFNKHLHNTIAFTGMISVPMAFGLFGVAPTLIPVFLGDEFLDSTAILQVLSFVLLFSGLNSIVGNQCLIAKGRQKSYNIAVTVAAVLNIILDYLFILKWKALGAAAATLIAEMTILALFLLSCKGDLRLEQILGCWKKYIIISIPMMVVLFYVSSSYKASVSLLLAEFIIGVAYYFSALTILKDAFVIKIFDYAKKKLRNKLNKR